MLRVIGGKYKSRKLKQPPKDITRPTMDRVKEAIFNIIQFKIKDTIVLDLFSGSGSLGIEAASRGAMKIIAVDRSNDSINTIKENINNIGIENIEVVKSDVISFINSKNGAKFDFIFMDPPFADYNIYMETFDAIIKNKILKETGLIILETKDPKKLTLPSGLTIHDSRKYGISNVLLIANNI